MCMLSVVVRLRSQEETVLEMQSTVTFAAVGSNSAEAIW